MKSLKKVQEVYSIMHYGDKKYGFIFGILAGSLIGVVLYVRLGLSLNADLQRIMDIILLEVISLLLLYFIGPYLLKILLNQKKKWDRMVQWWVAHKMVKIVIIVNALIFVIPLFIIAINYTYVFTWYEGLFPLVGIIFFTGLYLPAIQNKDPVQKTPEITSGVISTLIFMFFGYLFWVWILMGFVNGFNVLIIYQAISNNSKNGTANGDDLQTVGKEKRHITKRKAIKGTLITLMLCSPILNFAFENIGFGYLTLMAGEEPDVMFVDWTWEYEGENPRLMTDEILDAIQTCNNLDRIDVSITINLHMDYIHGNKNRTMIDQVQALLDHGIRVNIMPFNPKTPSHYYVNDFTVDVFNETYQEFKLWMHNSGFDGKITMLIVDIEPLIENVSVIFDAANEHALHAIAIEKLTNLVDLMKSEMHPLGTKVIGAAFGYAAVDLMDLDESVFRVLNTPTYPPTNWDGIGFMNYFFQTGSEYATYSSCKMLTHYFGSMAIPYITSQEQSWDEILSQFQIIRNLGINVTGIWALHQFLNHDSLQNFIKIHQELNIPSDITFQVKGAFIPTIYTAISILDYLIWDSIIY